MFSSVVLAHLDRRFSPAPIILDPHCYSTTTYRHTLPGSYLVTYVRMDSISAAAITMLDKT